MTSEPVRLLEGLEASESERSLLRVGRSHAPVAYDVEEGAARFRAQLTALAAAGAVTAGAGASGSSTALRGKALLSKLAFKVVLGLMAGGVFAGAGVVGGMHLARTSGHVDSPPVMPQPDAVVAVPPPVSAPPIAETTPLPSAPVEAPPARLAMPRAPRDVSRRPTSSAPHAGGATTSPDPRDAVDEAPAANSQPPAGPSVEPPRADPPRAEPPEPIAPAVSAPKPPELLSEVRTVALARSLVERDPDAALELLEKTRREHPTGYFVEERQALTVLALSRAGRQSAAREQAAAFLRSYPNGPFSDRVRAVAGQ